MIIKKILNSSVILATDENGKESICLGKGVGYGKKIGDLVNHNIVDQIFSPIDSVQTKKYLELLDSIPPVYLEITQRIIAEAEAQLHSELNMSIYFVLMDHLNFAVERLKKNINITNRVYWEIKNYYPEEFNVGVYALNLLNEMLDVNLPKEEAANIAFHLINAQSKDNESGDGMKYAKMIGGIVNLVRYSIKSTLNTEGIHYQRFITHVKFFVERLFKGKMLEGANETLFKQMADLYPEDMEIAFKIKDYIQKVYHVDISKDELTYFAVHINRLQTNNDLS